uniref:hypothetical protein n=2 Tax=Ferrimicrobium acidiphilum TaxID=121039 RepID=UPI0023F1A189
YSSPAKLGQNTNETFAGLVGVWGFGMGLLVVSNLCRFLVSWLVTEIRIAGIVCIVCINLYS